MKNMKQYLINAFFISWLLFGILKFNRENTTFTNNWFSYLGFLAFAIYFLYSLQKAVKDQENNKKRDN